MKKYIIFIIAITLLITVFAGCNCKDIKNIDDEVIETFEVIKAEDSNPSDAVIENLQEDENGDDVDNDAKLDEKFATIDFYLVAGVYTRNVFQEDAEVLEMFAQDRNNFVRVASNDLEQEVYAYNYLSDDFTYLYYFDGELLSKTVLNVDTGAILQDDDNYAALLLEDAKELKEYFYSLLEIANISAVALES